MSPAAAAAGILVGGRSARMGSDKAALDVGGETLLARMVRILSGFSDDVLVATRRPIPDPPAGARLVFDRLDPPCVLAGLHAALEHARRDEVLICAVDMPYVSVPLARHLLSLSPGWDAVVPESPRGLERLHAVYTRRCLPAIERAMAEGRRDVPAFYPDCRVRVVPVREDAWSVDGRSPFTNLNTPEDYRAFLRGPAATGDARPGR